MFYVLTAVALWLLLPRLLRKFAAWKGQSDAERSFTTRFVTATCLLSFVFFIAALHLPPVGCVLLMAPIFVAGTTLAKWWQTSRKRLRRQAEEESNFAQARRIN